MYRSNHNIEANDKMDVLIGRALGKEAPLEIDAEADLNKLHSRLGITEDIQPKKRQIGIKEAIVGFVAGAAAACLVMFFIMKQPESVRPVQVFMAENTASEDVTLQSASNKPVVLYDNHTSFEGLEAKGEAVQQIVTTPHQRNYHLTLSDGTEVYLNNDSQLYFPDYFEGNERTVYLKGEGYFKVAKDAKRPFYVQTERFATNVLGTEFNVRCYNLDELHVTLIEGKVEVKYGETDKAILKPGQDAYMRSDMHIDVNDVDTDVYTAWQKDEFYFDEITLIETAKLIGRWYNINVVFNNPKAMNQIVHYQGRRYDTIEKTIQQLNSMKLAKFRLHDGALVID